MLKAQRGLPSVQPQAAPTDAGRQHLLRYPRSQPGAGLPESPTGAAPSDCAVRLCVDRGAPRHGADRRSITEEAVDEGAAGGSI